MGDGAHGADRFTEHAGDVAGAIYRDGVKITDEAGLLRADGHTGPAIDASVPADFKQDRIFAAHVCLNFLVFGIRMEITGHGPVQLPVSLLRIVCPEYTSLFLVEFPHLMPQLIQPLILISFEMFGIGW